MILSPGDPSNGRIALPGHDGVDVEAPRHPLTRAAGAEHGRHRLQQNVDVEPGRPVAQVEQVALVVQNTVDSDVAYHVVTNAPEVYACRAARPLPFNAMVLHKGGQETRAECDAGTPLYLIKVETLEVPPLSAYYLSELPTRLAGLDDHTARGHRGVSSREPCVAAVPQVVQSGMERGDITWRDLVDFYARHRCQTYQFPSSYRALDADGQRAIPAVDSAM